MRLTTLFSAELGRCTRLEAAQRAFLATATRSASSSSRIYLHNGVAPVPHAAPHGDLLPKHAVQQNPYGSFARFPAARLNTSLLSTPTQTIGATTRESLTKAHLPQQQLRGFAAAGLAKKIMTVTPTAAERVGELMKLDKECKGIRISLRQRGCSGMSYVMDFQKDEPKKFDEVLEFVDGQGRAGKVFVDAQAVLFLVGTEMDYMEVEMGSEFVFNNPNEKGTCGCGQSFNV